MQTFKRFIKEEKGQALTEYGFILGFVALVCIVVINAFGEQLALRYEAIKDEILKIGTAQ